MSYYCNGTNQWLRGYMGTTYALPITLACWFKQTDHPVAIKSLVEFHYQGGTGNNDSVILRTTATDNTFTAAIISTTGSTGSAGASKNVDNTWTPFVGVFPSNSSRQTYVSDATGSGSGAYTVSDLFDEISLGVNAADAADFTGYLAEVAIWNKELSAGEIANFLAAKAPSSIAASNLIGYWPLNYNNATQTNVGTDASGDLTVTSATYSSDHPTIEYGTADIIIGVAPASNPGTKIYMTYQT